MRSIVEQTSKQRQPQISQIHEKIASDVVSGVRPGANASRCTVFVRIPQESALDRDILPKRSLPPRVFLWDPDKDGGPRQPLAGHRNDVSVQHATAPIL